MSAVPAQEAHKKVTVPQVVEALEKLMAGCLLVNRPVVEEFIRRVKENGIAPPDGWVLVKDEPIAVLRREIGEDDWFDWTPARPNSPESVAVKQSAQMDYCVVYAAAPEVKL